MPESWLQIEVRNFFLISALPTDYDVNGFGDSVPATLFVLIGLAIMGAIWDS